MQSTMDAVSSADPTGTLSALNASVKLVRAAVKLAPMVKNGYDKFQAHQAGKNHVPGGQQEAGLPSNVPGGNAAGYDVTGASTQGVAPIDNEQERRAYEKVNMILKTVGERVVKSGLVDELALARALTQVTAHIEVQLFSIENNKLFQSLANKLADPRLVNNVFTSIYLFAFLSSELEKSLPRYNGQISPGLRMVQQLFKVALGLDGFKENLHANLAAYKTLITTAAMLKPLDLDVSIFRDFPTFNTSRYSSQSRSFSDKMHYKNMYERLVKHFNERGFPQPLQGRDVGAITNWVFLTGDCNTREYVLEKVDLHIGENFGRVLYYLLCLANRAPDGTAIIAYHDQHIQLVRWFGPRFGYRVINARSDLNMAPHMQFMNPKLRAIFDTWVMIMPSQTLLQRRRTAAQAIVSQPMDIPQVGQSQQQATGQAQMSRRRPVSMMPQPVSTTASSTVHTPLTDPILQHFAAKQKEKKERMSSSGPSSASVHSDEFTSLPDSEPPVTHTNTSQETGTGNLGTNRPAGSAGGEPLLAALNTSPVELSPSDTNPPGSPNEVQPAHHRLSGGSNDMKIPTAIADQDASHWQGEIPGRQNSQSSLSGRRPNVQHRPSISSVAELDEATMSGTISGPAELFGTIDEHPAGPVEAPASSYHPYTASAKYEQAGPSPANPLYLGHPGETHSPVPSVSSLQSSPPPGAPGIAAPPHRPFARPAPPPPRVVRAVAMYDFEPETNDGQELAFRAGDMVEIIAKTRELAVGGWCTARTPGTWKTALAPISYLHELPHQGPPPIHRPTRIHTVPAPSHPPQEQFDHQQQALQQQQIQHEQHIQHEQQVQLDQQLHQDQQQQWQQGQQHGQQQSAQPNSQAMSQSEHAHSQSVTVNAHIPPQTNPTAYPGLNETHPSAVQHPAPMPLNASSQVPAATESTLAGMATTTAGKLTQQEIENSTTNKPHSVQQYGQQPHGAATEYYGSGTGAGIAGSGVTGYGSGGTPAPVYKMNYTGGAQQRPTRPGYVPSPLYPGYGPAPLPIYAASPVGAGGYAIPSAVGAASGSLGLSAAAKLTSSYTHNHMQQDYSMHANSTSLNLQGANTSLFSNDGNSSNQLGVTQSAVVADQDIVAPNQTIATTPGDFVVVDNAGVTTSPLAALAPNAGMTDTYFSSVDETSVGVSPLAGLATPAVDPLATSGFVDMNGEVDVTATGADGSTFVDQTDTSIYFATDGMGDTVVEQDTVSESAFVDAQGDTMVDADVSYDAYVESDPGDFDF